MPGKHGRFLLADIIGAGIQNSANWVVNFISSQSERIGFIKSRFPNITMGTAQAVVRFLESTVSAAENLNAYGYVPSITDIPIGSSAVGAGNVEYWVQVDYVRFAKPGENANKTYDASVFRKIITAGPVDMDELTTLATDDIQDLLGGARSRYESLGQIVPASGVSVTVVSVARGR